MLGRNALGSLAQRHSCCEPRSDAPPSDSRDTQSVGDSLIPERAHSQSVQTRDYHARLRVADLMCDDRVRLTGPNSKHGELKVLVARSLGFDADGDPPN